MLFWLARKKGVARTSDVMETPQIAASPSLNSSIQFALSNRVTPELINEVLCQESVIRAIKNDLMKTEQIGYKEVWRLGLITPDQDRYDPRPSQLSRREGVKRVAEDNNYRLNLAEQIPLKRAAALYNPGSFNTQFDRITVRGGLVKPRIGFYPGWTYGLSTEQHRGEFTRIRDTFRVNIEIYNSILIHLLLRIEASSCHDSYKKKGFLSKNRIQMETH